MTDPTPPRDREPTAVDLGPVEGPAVAVAERALVGALLWDPAAVADVAWLQVEDFSSPQSVALWSHLVQEHETGPRKTPLDAGAVSAALTATGQWHRDLVSPLAIATVMHEAIDTPAHRDYASMVLEASIRRQVRGLGVVVTDAVNAGPTAVTRAAATGVAISTAAQQRLDLAAGRREQVDPDLEALSRAWAGPHGLEARRAASKAQTRDAAQEATAGSPDGALRGEAAELAVLAATAYDAQVRPELLARFRPHDFTSPQRQATRSAVGALADTDRPIDPVTLTWEQARAARVHGPGLTSADLRELRQWSALGMAGAAGMAAQSATSLTRQATTAVAAAATDPAVDIETVLATSVAGYTAIAGGVARVTGRPVIDTLEELRARLLQLGRRPREPLGLARSGERVAASVGSDELAARRAGPSGPQATGPVLS
ncbi:DnaB-like helicase N-terminal domain-containing protein [Jannaschia sp. R86511]|uniref:DnaB-like helicase N-terminal domain-containing protein n=1 Tax=Jannaschia sp. R86511 TaxID=3093853 RepID=UPI0036D36CB2